MQTKYFIYELEDGRIFWLNPGDDRVLKDGKFVPLDKPIDVTVDHILDGRPLTDDEINALISDGTLAQ